MIKSNTFCNRVAIVFQDLYPDTNILMGNQADEEALIKVCNTAKFMRI